MSQHRLFHCAHCGKSETTGAAFIDPVCCGAGMIFERVIFTSSPKGDEIVLSSIERANGDPFAAPTGVFEKPPWWEDPSYEIWALRGGRQHGERLGWVGREGSEAVENGGLVTIERWHIQMSPGVKPPATLTYDTKPEAVQAMLHAIMA